MSVQDTRIDEWIAQLGIELTALGPGQAREISDEVRADLEDATRRDGVDAALESFGSPRVFAAAVLKERGFGAEDASVTEAPVWRIAMAWLLDVAVALAPLALFVGFVGAVVWANWRFFRFVEVAVSTVFALASLWWAYYYWSWRRPENDRQSFGLTLFGLRSVRVGEHVRTLRQSDIAGSRPGIWYRVRAALAAIIIIGWLWGVGVSMARTMDQPTEVLEQVTQWDISSSIGAASTMYGMAMTGTPATELGSVVATDAVPGYQQIRERVTAGQVTSYVIGSAGELAYEAEPPTQQTDAQVTITVLELSTRDGKVFARVVECVVEKRVSGYEEYVGEGGSGSTWTTAYTVSSIQTAPESESFPWE